MKPNDPRLYWYLEKLEELRLNPKTKIIGLNKEEFLEHIDFLFGPILDDQGKTLFIEDFRYIPYVTDKILKINLREYLNAKGNVPQEIIQAAEELGDDGEIERTRLEARNKVEAFIKRQEQLKATNIAQAQEDISRKAQVMVKASLPGSLARDAEVVKKLSRVIENELTAAYLETILPDDLSPQVLQKVTQHVIETADLPEQLVAAESSLPPNVAQLIKANLRNLSWSTETTATIKELNQTGFVLPRPLREKMPTTGGPVSIMNAIRHPQLFLQKVALFPIAKTTEVVGKASLDNEEFLLQEIKNLRADPHANSQKIVALEWQLYESSRFRTKNKIFSFFTGLTKTDLKQFRAHLTVTLGLSPTDPSVQYIDNQIGKMAMLEQRSLLARFYQQYLRFNREAGLIQPKIEVGQREYFLPRTKPISGFGQKIISFGEQIGYYRQFVEYPGISVLRSVPLQKFADFRSFIARKTLQPIFARLGQTAIGQGIKSGIRGIISKGATQSLIKFGTTILTRLGIKGLTTALGTAIDGPLGTAIGLAVGFVIDKAKDLLSKFKQLFTRPEFALSMGAISGIFFIGVPGTIGMVGGAFFATLSGIGLAAGAGGILSGASAATVAILTAFFTTPLGAPVASMVIGIILGLFFLTLFIVFLTASAFIIPAAPTERVSEYLEVEKTIAQNEKIKMVEGQYKIENKDLPATANYTVTVNAKQTINITSAIDERSVTCQLGSNPQFEERINLPLNSKGPNSWEAKYSLDIDDSFKDCRLCNTVTVIANIEGGPTGEMAFDTQCIKIGNPPEDCPEGWPTEHGSITQGPNTNDSHAGKEAIDIGVPKGTIVNATHEGVVIEPNGWEDPTVLIQGKCNGETFISAYTHLKTISVRPGDQTSRGTPIGTSGTTYGYPGAGDHLHYEFLNDLEMAWPYIGTNSGLDDIFKGCVGRTECTKPYSQW